MNLLLNTEEGCGGVRLGFACDGEGWSNSNDFNVADGRLGFKDGETQ
uniref:Uncharacterized protein n=1 Tax=Cucumis melo TaxID=3656 RepID=A0A9I9ECT0_CUCME